MAAGNSATAYYSTTARTSVAYRVVGYVESTQATAGTWATTPSTLQGKWYKQLGNSNCCYQSKVSKVTNYQTDTIGYNLSTVEYKHPKV